MSSNEFALLWIWLGLINIEDLPSLVGALMSTPDQNIGVDGISASLDIEYLALGVDHVLTLESEDLPPSRASGVHPNV